MMFSTTLNTEGNGTQMSSRPLTLEDLQSTQMLVTTHVRAVLVSIFKFKGPILYQFHTAVTVPITVYSKCLAPNTSMVLNFSHLKVAQVCCPENRLLCLHLEMLMTSLCQHLPCLLHAPLTQVGLRGNWEVFSLALGESSAHTVTNVQANSLG